MMPWNAGFDALIGPANMKIPLERAGTAVRIMRECGNLEGTLRPARMKHRHRMAGT